MFLAWQTTSDVTRKHHLEMIAALLVGQHAHALLAIKDIPMKSDRLYGIKETLDGENAYVIRNLLRVRDYANSQK